MKTGNIAYQKQQGYGANHFIKFGGADLRSAALTPSPFQDLAVLSWDSPSGSFWINTIKTRLCWVSNSSPTMLNCLYPLDQEIKASKLFYFVIFLIHYLKY
jgi:hypothetical protein